MDLKLWGMHYGTTDHLVAENYIVDIIGYAKFFTWSITNFCWFTNFVNFLKQINGQNFESIFQFLYYINKHIIKIKNCFKYMEIFFNRFNFK